MMLRKVFFFGEFTSEAFIMEKNELYVTLHIPVDGKDVVGII